MALPVNKPTKADIILTVIILTISVIAIVFLLFSNFGNATGIEIRIDGKTHSYYSFADLDNCEIIEIKTQYGYNKFLYENNSIKCIDTDCKDKIELKAGAISKTNQVLICLPHKLTVHVVGKNHIDAVSY